MKGLGTIISLVIVAAIGLSVYKLYFSQLQATSGSANPTQTVDVTGVKNDLLSIAQSERLYQAQHGSYASLSELTSSGAMSLAKTGRAGYTYDVETSSNSFRVTARCASAAASGCTNYAVDDTMQVQPAP